MSDILIEIGGVKFSVHNLPRMAACKAAAITTGHHGELIDSLVDEYLDDAERVLLTQYTAVALVALREF